MMDLLLADQSELSTLTLVLIFAGYATCCALACLASTYQLRHHFRIRRRRTQYLLFSLTLALLIPVVGLLAVLLVLAYALRHPSERSENPLMSYTLPDLPEEPEQTAPTLGSLRDLLQYAATTEVKHMIVNATRNMSDLEAVPLLRLLLLDPDDEIRLMAYVSLDQKEFALMSKIYRYKRRVQYLSKDDAAMQARINLRLAQWYWELVYIGLAEHDLKDFALERAREHIELAYRHADNVEIRLLYGKILIAQQNPGPAIGHIQAAREYGATDEQTLPYLAEAEFEQGNVAGVRSYLRQLELSRHYPVINQMKGFWR